MNQMCNNYNFWDSQYGNEYGFFFWSYRSFTYNVICFVELISLFSQEFSQPVALVMRDPEDG